MNKFTCTGCGQFWYFLLLLWRYLSDYTKTLWLREDFLNYKVNDEKDVKAL